MEAIRRTAVEVLDEAGDEGIELEKAMQEVADRAGIAKDQARVNLLIVSNQEHKGDATKLVLSSEFDADEFLEGSEPTAQDTLDEDSEPIEDESPTVSDEVSDVPPGEWSSETFDLGDLEDLPSAPKPVSERYKNLRKLKDVGHDLVPAEREFIDQKHRGSTTEMEWFTYLANDSDFGVVIEGEPGTAKGTMVKAAAAEANQPVVRINMGVSINKEKLVGGFVPKENGNSKILQEAKDLAADDENLSVGQALEMLGAKDQFEWKDGLFTLAFRRGWWVLVDEINAAEAETLMPFFGALEQGDDASLELTEPSESVKPHPNFRFIATMNPPHHEGTYRLNDALKDRCHHMKKDYLPQETEADLIRDMAEVSITKTEANKIAKLANQVRSSYPKELDQTLTPRGCKRIADYTELLSLEEAAKEELLSRATYEDTVDALERAVEAVMGSGSSSEDLGELFG